MTVTYLDNNATTKPAAQAADAVAQYMTEFYGNPSSVHRFGQRSRQAIDQARAQVANLIGCGDSELLFTGGGTESINLVIRSLLATRAPRRRIITSAVEHSATRELCLKLAEDGLAEIVEIPVDGEGLLDPAQLETAIDDQTALVTMLWANNETGVLFPVERIAEICRSRRVPFHVDGTQAVGKIPVDVKAIGVDAMTAAAHKFHGPKGVGMLYARRGLRIRPLIIGGPQERNRRGGTENVPGIAGAGVAAELAAAHLGEMQRVAALRDRLESSILDSIDIAHINGSREHRLPNTTNIGFERLESEAILLLLSEQGICASAGAACSSGSLEPSHVLRAMRIDPLVAHGAIRFSLSRFTTDQDIDHCLKVLPGVIDRLRSVLPAG